MKVKCIIIDDEPLATRVIRKHLESFDDFDVTHTFNNPVEAFHLLSKGQIDLVFLDINMPRLNGIEFIRNLTTSPFIIITTAYREYAVESFELDVIDYLVKPISLKRLMKALNKVSQQINLRTESLKENTNDSHTTSSKNAHFFVKVNKKMVKINFDEILYIESLKDYVSIKTTTQDYITHYNLSAITKLVPEQDFMRIHRSFTISLQHVKAIEGNCVHIHDKMIPIGRNYIKEVKCKILSGFAT
ncbi:response regulator transcription factor [Aquimarina sp. U1-2]|uniref:LytR/AlgR family response regulator transcription factor n=1 Tax=Aquimarina sp. U1-2 TaxID=2823141 RepID=UPI001AECC736|nr:LytTR family DNA-binding domain-containing protein [Aquimarina sp. U1-2]MBP2833009.1 response regulator transcription factor [Aquimarina sp. U1-2]